MKIISKLVALVGYAMAAFAANAQACPAEFGPQDAYPGLKAGADLRNAQYTIQRLTGQFTTDICTDKATAAAGKAIGVLQNDPNTNEAATIAYTGLSKVVGGGTMTVGKYITCDASGRAVDAASGDVIVGTAMETLATAGHIGTVMLFPPVRSGSVA